MSITNAKVFNLCQTKKGYTFGNHEGLASVAGEEKANQRLPQKRFIQYRIGYHQVSYIGPESSFDYPRCSAVKS
jgi:hypothetical protein